MANKRISQLPPASSPLSGDTLLPVELTTGDTKRATLQQLRPTVSVTDFGAVGNGVADDTAEIQAAINSLAASGGNVFVPRGTYVVSAPITVPTKVSVIGEGLGETFFSATTAFTNLQAVFYANDADYSQFVGFSILGNTNGTLGAGSGIHVRSAQGVLIDRVYVSNTTQAGIRLEEVNTVTVDGCWLESCGRTGYADNHGIMLYSTSAVPCYTVKITNNVVRNTFRKGIATYAPSAAIYDLLIQGNSVSGSGLGNIYVGDAQHREIQILDNWCNGGYVNIQFGDAKHSVVARNVCINSTSDFNIGVYGLQNCVIANNIVKDSRTTGISLFQPAAQTCEAVVIEGNTVMNSNRVNGPSGAIQLVATSRSIIANNVIFDESGAIRATYGVVEIAGSDNNQVQGNLVYNVSAANYLLVGSGSSLQENVAGQYFGFGSGFKVNHTSLTLANGTNNNVALPANCGTVTVTGPTGAYEITGLTGGALGRQIKLVNSTSQTLTLKINSGSSSAANRLFLTGSVDKTVAAWSAISLTYLSTQGSNFWMDA